MNSKFIYRLITLIASIYLSFAFYIEKNNDSTNSEVEREVVYINCVSSRRTSYIHIKHDKTVKQILLKYNDCKQLDKGDYINVIYDKELNSYHIKGDATNKRLAIFSWILFTISFIKKPKFI